MRIAVIAPTALLSTYATLGDNYHLCLSERVLHDVEYAAFYRERSDAGDYVILDNSAHEQLEGDSITALVAAASVIKPSEIVLPDRLFFGDDTLERSTEAENVLRTQFPHVKLMGVPQGRTTAEWVNCLSGLCALGVDTIGISKDYEVWVDNDGLHSLVNFVKSYAPPELDVHMLGWGRDLHKIAYLPVGVRGIDSAKPLVYAQNGVRLPHVITQTNIPKYPRRTSGFFEAQADEINDAIARHNIDVFRAHANGRAAITARVARLGS